jgi:hypothetical protein
MIISPKEPFILPDYAEAMACASLTTRHSSEPHRRYLGDPRVLDLLNINAIEDNAFPPDCSASYDKGVIYSCPSSSGSSYASG